MDGISLIPGLLLVLLISILSQYLAIFTSIESLTIAIILGILYGNIVKVKEIYKPGISFSLKKLLKLGIILLGFKLNFQSILKLGPLIILSVFIYIPVTLLSAIYLGRRFGINNKIATLIGVGSSICGASAILAVAPSIQADEDDAVISVSVINILGTVGILLYSAIASVSILSDTQFGIWSGLTLQGVPHALAAAYSRGTVSGEIGTIVKLSRVLFLVPVSIILSYTFRNSADERSHAKFPKYILYFIIAGIVNSISILPASITSILGLLSSWLILLSMTAMGMLVKTKDIKEKGNSALLLGSLLFAAISAISYFIIIALF